MTHWKEPINERHRDYVSGSQDAGGVPIDRSISDGWVYFVRVCAFTFSFANLDQLREAIQYFGQTIHAARRSPGCRLEHYWQRWFERLPPGLIGGSKRARVRRGLTVALGSFATQARPRAGRASRSGSSRDSELAAKRFAIAGVIPPTSLPEAIVASSRRFIEAKGGTLHGVVLQRRGVSRAKAPGGVAAARCAKALSSSTFLGAGKAMELARLCRALSIGSVLFLNALPRAQRERLEVLTESEVVLAPRELLDALELHVATAERRYVGRTGTTT
jgi:hypothetical protein